MRRARAAALLTLLLFAPSCDWAGNSKAVRIPYSELKQRLDESHTKLKRAVEDGALDRAPAATREMNARFDELSAQASAMNLLDREHLAINIATGRRCLTAIDRFCASGDQELVRAQLDQLAPTVAEIQVLLDRADKITTAE